MRSVKHVEQNTSLSDQGSLAPETLSLLKHHAWDRNYYT
jgi:hypothetical protein